MPQRPSFQPVSAFTWEINRAERSRQIRWLVPLLDAPEGREWFLERLGCPCSAAEAASSQAFHLCFPLRDILTADYYQCRGNPSLEDEFIRYYNCLLGLPADFGITEIWHTAPRGEIRHPAAPGRSGWSDEFLRDRIADQDLYKSARDARRGLGTEADVFILTEHYVIIVECKYQSGVRNEQYDRHVMMGTALATRLGRLFHFGMVVDGHRDPNFARIQVPHVLWTEVQMQLDGCRHQ